jgi:hypothetical protein
MKLSLGNAFILETNVQSSRILANDCADNLDLLIRRQQCKIRTMSGSHSEDACVVSYGTSDRHRSWFVTLILSPSQYKCISGL